MQKLNFSLSKGLLDIQWGLISVVSASFAHFILRIILGKNLGPEGLGIYTLAFTVYLFGVQFAGFGIGQAITKYTAEFQDDRLSVQKYVSSGMAGSIISGVIIAIVLFILAPVIAVSFFQIPDLTLFIQLTAICYPFIAIQKAVLGTLNGFRRMREFAVLNIIQNVSIFMVSAILVLYFNLNVLGGVIGYILPTIVVSLLSPFMIREFLACDTMMWHLPSLYQTTAFGFYIILGQSVSFFSNYIGSILLGYYLYPSDVGIYAVAVVLAQILTLVPTAVRYVTGPAIANLYGKGEMMKIRNLIFSTMIKTFCISLVIALIIAVFGPQMIVLFFSEEFLPAYLPLLILILGNLIFAPYMAVNATLQNIGKVEIPYRINVVCGICTIVMSVLLIPPFGITGAAAAATIVLLVNFVISMIVINRFFPYHAVSNISSGKP